MSNLLIDQMPTECNMTKLEIAIVKRRVAKITSSRPQIVATILQMSSHPASHLREEPLSDALNRHKNTTPSNLN